MSGYFQIIYCLQEKSTHFGLEVSVVYIISSLYVRNCYKYFSNTCFGTKCPKKLEKKIFKLYQVFMC